MNGRKDKNWKVSRIVSIPFRIYSCNFLITVNPTVLVFNCWGENSIQFGPGSLIIRHRVILDIDSGWITPFDANDRLYCFKTVHFRATITYYASQK